MKIWQPNTWSITTRLVLVAVVPALLMFLVVSASLYITSVDEVRASINERGELVAAALAETSQYAVVSGNIAYLEQNLRQLLKADRSIAAIDVLDTERKPIVAVRAQPVGGSIVFERPILSSVPEINLFEQTSGPHVSSAPGTPTAFRTGQTAGYVRVHMSPTPVFQERRGRLYLAAGMVLVATVFSGLAGLYLAQRLRAPLAAVMVALRQIRRGEYGVQLHTRASGELGELQEAIVKMAKGLRSTRQDLEEQVADRTRELQLADAEKRQLIHRTNVLLEEERRRIAVEIHDDLNAALVAVSLKAGHIASLAARLGDDQVARDVERTANAISNTTKDLYSAARNIVKRLRPEVIDTLGLTGAVEEMIRHYDRLHPACTFSLHVSHSFPDLRGELAITCYRVVQEALSNVVKHAHATRATVTMEQVGTSAVSIIIADNGSGFDVSARVPGRMGVVGMRERVAAAGGTIGMTSAAEQGATLAIELPLPPAEASDSPGSIGKGS